MSDLGGLPEGPGDRAEHLEDTKLEAGLDHLPVEMGQEQDAGVVAHPPVQPQAEQEGQQLGRVGRHAQAEQPAHGRAEDRVGLPPGEHDGHEDGLDEHRQNDMSGRDRAQRRNPGAGSRSGRGASPGRSRGSG